MRPACRSAARQRRPVTASIRGFLFPPSSASPPAPGPPHTLTWKRHVAFHDFTHRQLSNPTDLPNRFHPTHEPSAPPPPAVAVLRLPQHPPAPPTRSMRAHSGPLLSDLCQGPRALAHATQAQRCPRCALLACMCILPSAWSHKPNAPNAKAVKPAPAATKKAPVMKTVVFSPAPCPGAALAACGRPPGARPVFLTPSLPSALGHGAPSPCPRARSRPVNNQSTAL